MLKLSLRRSLFFLSISEVLSSMMPMFERAIVNKSTKVKPEPSFRKMPSRKTIGARMVQRIWTEMICFVSSFFCLKKWLSRSGAKIFRGGRTTNKMEERLISFIFE